MEKLSIASVGSNVGGFVKTLNGATGTGFAEGTHVHKDWWAQTQSYDQIHDKMEDAARMREDVLVPLSAISGEIVGDKFALKVEDRYFEPTDWALSQMSTRLEIPSSTILRELRKLESFDSGDAETMAKITNNAIRRLDPTKNFRLRTYSDGTLRAFVTEKYGPVDNRWYLDVLREFLPDGRISHWKGDEDTIYGNLLLPDSVIDYGQSDDSDYGAMLSISNCEIGKRRVSQRPSVFRSICMNGCIWGGVEGEDVNKRHSGKIDLELFKIRIAENIEKQLPILDNGIRNFLATAGELYTTKGASIKNVFAVVGTKMKLTKAQTKESYIQWASHESEFESLFGVINGITRAAQTFDPSSWVNLDFAGGELLNMSPEKWKTVVKSSFSLDDADVEAIFAGAA